jgi:hypothetical protein
MSQVKTVQDLHNEEFDDVELTTTPDEPTPPAEPAATDPPEPPAPANPAEPAVTKTLEFTDDYDGIEQFLAQYNIEGGMITFEDGSTVHFNDLSNKEKAQILTELTGQYRPKIEEEFDLDDEEIKIINFFRQSGKTFNDVVDEIVTQRLETYVTQQQAQVENFEAMPDDAVFVKWLKKVDPDITEEKLEEELAVAKASTTFAKQAQTLRQNFKEEQQAAVNREEARRARERDQELDDQRYELVGAISPLKEVAQFPITDVEKNAVLEDLLEVNSVGDSIFLEKVFSDPVKLFETAWLAKFGKQKINELETYYKKAITDARNKGREEALAGNYRAPVSGVKKPETKVADRQVDNSAISIEDLHNEQFT